jgi:hypothetical protein
METLTLKDLQIYSDKFIDNIENKFSKYLQFCLTLKETGLRPIELIEVERFKQDTPFQYSCVTAKRSNIRLFTPSELRQELKSLISTDTTYYFQEILVADNVFGTPFFDSKPYEIIYNYLISIYDKCQPAQLYIDGTKPLKLYHFRHLYIKELYFESGWTVQQISTKIGERHNANTLGYINSVIKK